MLNIIRADLYRIFRGRAIYVTLAILILLLMLQAVSGSGGFVVTAGDETVIDNDVQVAATGMAAPGIAAESTDNLVFFMLAIVVITAGADFSADSAKNVLSRGTSRARYYLARLIPVCLAALVIQALNFLVPLLTVTALHGFGGKFTLTWLAGALKPFLWQSLLLMAFGAIGVALAFTTRKVAAINSLYLALVLIPAFILVLLSVMIPEAAELMGYLMFQNLTLLAEPAALTGVEFVRAMSLGLFWLVGSTVAGVAAFSRTDIK